MAKLNMESAMKYLVVGGVAVAAAPLVAMIPGVPGILANIPFWGQAILGTLTIGNIVLGGVGAGVVDQLVYKK